MKDDPKKIYTIDGEMEMFYSALGQLNTNIVAYLLKHPDEIAAITDSIRGFLCSESSGDCSRYGSDYQWSETMRACVRKPTASQLADVV